MSVIKCALHMLYGRNCYVGQCDLIRPPVLKIGQCDQAEVHLRSLEDGNIPFTHCLPGVYQTCDNQ